MLLKGLVMVRMMAIGVALALAAGQVSVAMAQGNGLVLYGAGSLREAMSQVAEAFGARQGIPVKTEFGASGRMRERIEAGDEVDVFTSADIGHARKLVADGRASAMAMFAQNALCVLAPTARGPLTSDRVLDALLKEGTKIGVSPPVIDPLGDYTVRLFEVAEKLRPGSRQSLQSRAVVIDDPPGSPPARSGDTFLDALQDGRVDLAIVYCSGKGRYARLRADVSMVAFPSDLAVGPQYGLAVLKGTRPEAMLLALTILSPEGQAILAANGFRPIGVPDAP